MGVETASRRIIEFSCHSRPDGGGGEAPAPAPGGGGTTTDGCSVETSEATLAAGGAYTTLQLKCELPENAANVYVLTGTEDTPMSFPAAFQVAAPFGSDIGGPDAAFIAFNGDVAFDSFLCVGDPAGDLSASPGFPIEGWAASETVALETTDGAIFYMDPGSGPASNGAMLFAQLTLANGVYEGGGTARGGLQGRSVGGADDWQGYEVVWEWGAGGGGSDPCQGVVCPEATGQCKVAGTCQPSNGQCAAETTATDGTSCDDGDADTNSDVCAAGVCAGVASPPPAPPSGGGGGGATTDGCSVETLDTALEGGYTTIQLKCELPENAANVYVLAGTPTTPMSFPAAYQVAAPFGSDIGAPNPAFIAFNPDVAFDSYLTVGDDTPLGAGALAASPGPGGADAIDAWGVSESVGIESTDGAIFYMDPNTGPASDGAMIFAQLTLANGAYAAGGRATADLQGRSAGGRVDWSGDGVVWQW